MKEAKNTPKKELEKSYYKRTKEKLIEVGEPQHQNFITYSQKDFTISGGTKSFENLKPEVDKCILVCHREIHAGLVDLELLNLVL